jgi:pyrroline-5-carboxylate reductase
MKQAIGVIGLGNMGYPIYKKIPLEFDKIAYDPYLNKEDVVQEKSLNDVIKKANILILCVKPDKISGILQEIKVPKNIISIAAGITLNTMKEVSHTDSNILRIMPNLPLLSEEGVIACIGNKSIFEIAKLIFKDMGMVVELANENEIDIITALSGSGPAYVFTFIHALAEGGLKCGLSYSQSLRIAIQTVKGSAIFLENELDANSNLHPYHLRNKVTSPGGTTIYGLGKLEEGNFNFTVMESVNYAYLRAKELGKRKKD